MRMPRIRPGSLAMTATTIGTLLFVSPVASIEFCSASCLPPWYGCTYDGCFAFGGGVGCEYTCCEGPGDCQECVMYLPTGGTYCEDV